MATDSPTVWIIDPTHSKIRFDVKYLMISSVSGWFSELEGSIVCHGKGFGKSDIQLTIYTNSVYTGIEDRDNHLRSADFFDVKNYPTIQFQSTGVRVRENKVYVSGNLQLKGVSHPIKYTSLYLGTVPDAMGNTKAAFEIDLTFNRKDFDLTWNQYFDKSGVLISDEVKVHADVQLMQLKAELLPDLNA